MWAPYPGTNVSGGPHRFTYGPRRTKKDFPLAGGTGWVEFLGNLDLHSPRNLWQQSETRVVHWSFMIRLGAQKEFFKGHGSPVQGL